MSHTQILSVVAVVDDRQAFATDRLVALCSALGRLAVPYQVVVVANSARRELAAALRELTTRQEDLQVLVLKHPVDYHTALLAGFENAIGDWVATLDLCRDDAAVVPAMFESALRDGTEVVLGHDAGAGRRSPLDALLATLFHRSFQALHGFRLSDEAPSARLLSRSVVNLVLQHDSPLVAFETLTAAGGFRKASVPLRRVTGPMLALGERVRIRWRTLIGMNAVPLRLANLLCGLGASLAFVYSIYVVLTYLLRDDVVPGWTTVSLILSAMFMMLSLVLWLLSEYMILLLDAGARRPRYEIADEFASEVQTRRRRLNVETEV